MYKVKNEALKKCHKPFDVVTNKDGDVGFIEEVNVNSCQEDHDFRISYSVNWMVGNKNKHAWFMHDELTAHCNIFVEIAKASCNSHGNNSRFVESIFGK